MNPSRPFGWNTGRQNKPVMITAGLMNNRTLAIIVFGGDSRECTSKNIPQSKAIQQEPVITQVEVLG
jgi:hypothetical protein